jgi:hypothetical protein
VVLIFVTTHLLVFVSLFSTHFLNLAATLGSHRWAMDRSISTTNMNCEAKIAGTKLHSSSGAAVVVQLFYVPDLITWATSSYHGIPDCDQWSICSSHCHISAIFQETELRNWQGLRKTGKVPAVLR